VKIPDNITPAIIQVGKVLSTLLPKFRLIPLEAEGVSSDPAVVQAYINDPLVYRGKTTARLAAEILKAMQRVMKQAGQITLPVLIVQGSADRIVSPEGARMLYDAIQSPDKTIKVYDGFYHEVYNEPGRGQVLRDVETWLEMHRTEKKV
jgi:alpha-beta hydrolase superfamily lysophospholipase